MNKTIITTGGRKLEKIGRKKKIYYSSDNAYFIWNGKRVSISENVFPLTYPIFYNKHNHYLMPIQCYMSISNCIYILIEIDEYMEWIQMYRELD